MLTIEIRLNKKLIAAASATNITQLADISDYAVEIVEDGSPVTGLSTLHHEGHIAEHPRRQTVWSLVQKIAERAVKVQAMRAAPK